MNGMALPINPTKEWDDLYWSFNLPLQMWPNKDGGWRVLNYMPRKERCVNLDDKVNQEELSQFCKNAATILRNLSTLFELLGEGKIDYIYYPDKTPEEAIQDAQERKNEGPTPGGGAAHDA